MARPPFRIGVVSDTHIPYVAPRLPAALIEGLAGVELILHAGDIACLSALEELERVAPVAAVSGNCDPPEVRAGLPAMRVVEVRGRRIGLWHGRGGPAGLAARAHEVFRGKRVDVVVFGHSHQPWEDREGEVLRFNPGSPTSPLFTGTPSFGILALGERVESAVISLER